MFFKSADANAVVDNLYKPNFFGSLVAEFRVPVESLQFDDYEATFNFGLSSIANAVPLLQLYSGILKEYDIPAEFSLLPLVESANNPLAQSHKNAVGLWQFIPVTSHQHGLKMTDDVDERQNVLLSTKAAARHLAYLHTRLHDWVLVTAAYNCGVNCVIRAIAAENGEKNFNVISRRLPLETRNYVYKFFLLRSFIVRNYSNPILSRFPNGIYLQRQLSSNVGSSERVAADRADMEMLTVTRFLNHGVDLSPTSSGSKEMIVTTDLFRKYFSENKISFRTVKKNYAVPKCGPLGYEHYRVAVNDSLRGLALKLGISVDKLRELNSGLLAVRKGMLIRLC
jgi:membrane-bound lytic murein transglycosylase D